MARSAITPRLQSLPTVTVTETVSIEVFNFDDFATLVAAAMGADLVRGFGFEA
jgi:hypothetical protein